MTFVKFILPLLSTLAMTFTLAETPRLVVVKDLGGVSASPYYQSLSLKTDAQETTAPPQIPAPVAPDTPYHEADLLPIRPTRLTPGSVDPRAIQAPGLRPIFLIGDDRRSRDWLRKHVDSLRQSRAIGFVVHVDTIDALNSLRQLAPGLTLIPASGDDLAERLDLLHYPALITDTRIEQ